MVVLLVQRRSIVRLRCPATEGFKSFPTCMERFVIFFLVLAGVFGNASGQTLTSLHFFGSSGLDGVNPSAVLIQGSDGNFYGTTEAGGTNGQGTVFRISSAGTLTTLWQFGSGNGDKPYEGLIQGTNGNLYGTTFFGGSNGWGIVFGINSEGTLTTLYQFDWGGNGTYPYAGLVQGSDHNFYGTTWEGGQITIA
jgi:uncharacterized repeat protein (TIGR03803 family)